MLYRSGSVALVLAGLCCACGSDQKNSSTPADLSREATPPPAADELPAASAETPEPSNTPPSSPPSQSSNNASSANALATSTTAERADEGPLSQDQIVQVTRLANEAEIKQAKLAESKAQKAEVKQFASLMMSDHTQAKESDAQLCRKLDLTPMPSPESNLLKTDANRILGKLRGAEGAAFDHAYIDAQVEEHQQVLDALDQRLIPAAKAPELRDYLKKMRSVVAGHLQRAQAIQSELKATP